MLVCRTAWQQKTLPTVRVFQAIRTTTLLHTGEPKDSIIMRPILTLLLWDSCTKIKVCPDNVIVCSGVGTSITTGRTEFGPTHAGSLPNSKYFFSSSFRLQQNLWRFHFCFPSDLFAILSLSLRYSSMSLKLNTEGITFMSCQQRQFVAVQKGLGISAKSICLLSPNTSSIRWWRHCRAN